MRSKKCPLKLALLRPGASQKQTFAPKQLGPWNMCMFFTALPRTLLPNLFFLLQLAATNGRPEHKVHYNPEARSSSHLRRTTPHTSCLQDNVKKAGHANLWAHLAIAGKNRRHKPPHQHLLELETTFFGKCHTRRWPPKIQTMRSIFTIFWVGLACLFYCFRFFGKRTMLTPSE